MKVMPLEERLRIIFDEWANRYATDPGSFYAILDAHGNAVTDYGTLCSAYFLQINDDLEKQGILPCYSTTLSEPNMRPEIKE